MTPITKFKLLIGKGALIGGRVQIRINAEFVIKTNEPQAYLLIFSNNRSSVEINAYVSYTGLVSLYAL